MDEVIISKQEIARILRIKVHRARFSISLMAFSGLRPETMGNYEGYDGLRLSDLEDLDIDASEFSRILGRISVSIDLCKARIRYLTFIGIEGTNHIIAYL